MNMVGLKEMVVPREKATFWLDRWGYWCNEHGRFEHPKIIDYFHAAIARDAGGYHVFQINGNVREKVYFRHEDTALFVFDVLPDDIIILVLNTRRQIALNPGRLFIRNDYLYTRHEGELIKFNEASMLKISRYFEYENDNCLFCFKGQRTPIPEADDDPWPEGRHPGTDG